jgi:hypothetical protein
MAAHTQRIKASLAPASVFAVGLALRLGAVAASRGGLGGNYGYDPSVYYTAADAFVHGRMPYRDFVLLHPPGLMLVLAPFAVLGRLTTDSTGFVAGNVALAALGAANALLVYLVARQLGTNRAAAWLGGMFYAVWYGAVYAELSIRLEPLGSLAFLLGMLAMTRDRPQHLRRDTVLAGAAFGFALSVKMWWAAPFVIVALWLTRRAGRRRRVPAFLAGAAATLVVVDGPFFAMAPSAMWHMVVTEQLGRPSLVPFLYRTITFSTLHGAIASIRGTAQLAASVLFGVVVIALLAAAARLPAARLAVLIAAAQIVVLLTCPSFFAFYLDYVAAALAIVVAAAAHTARQRLRDRVRTGSVAAFVAAAACITVSGLLVHPVGFIERFPADELADTLPHVRCVMTISPMALIELDALSRDLRNGCPVWVDTTGRTYGVDALSGPHYVRRRYNRKWQADVRRYLTSGGAFVLIGDDGSLDARTLAAIRANRLIVQEGSVSLYEVVPAPGSRLG